MSAVHSSVSPLKQSQAACYSFTHPTNCPAPLMTFLPLHNPTGRSNGATFIFLMDSAAAPRPHLVNVDHRTPSLRLCRVSQKIFVSYNVTTTGPSGCFTSSFSPHSSVTRSTPRRSLQRLRYHKKLSYEEGLTLSVSCAGSCAGSLVLTIVTGHTVIRSHRKGSYHNTSSGCTSGRELHCMYT